MASHDELVQLNGSIQEMHATSKQNKSATMMLPVYVSKEAKYVSTTPPWCDRHPPHDALGNKAFKRPLANALSGRYDPC